MIDPASADFRQCEDGANIRSPTLASRSVHELSCKFIMEGLKYGEQFGSAPGRLP